jgi:serine/threonine protein kinase
LKKIDVSELLQSYLYQLLCGLRYLHSANIIHRDLKPRNILVAGDRTLKICDLGQARRVPRDRKMSKRVGTLSYKAPEILLHSSVYTSAADVWSVGCIVVECLLGKTLFTGDNEENMLNAIYEVLCSLFKLIKLKVLVPFACKWSLMSRNT